MPLQDDVWHAFRYSAHKLPANLRRQLVQVYSDIFLLNQIVRISTQVGYRSSFIEEHYRKGTSTITERLKRIKEDLK